MNFEQKNKFHMFFFEEHLSAVYYFFTGIINTRNHHQTQFLFKFDIQISSNNKTLWIFEV